MSQALKIQLDTKSSVFSDFGYRLRLQCGRAPEHITMAGMDTRELLIPFSGHTGPHETLYLTILSSIDGMYQSMATATAKLNPGNANPRNVSVKFDSKSGAFDPFEVTVTYVLVKSPVAESTLFIKHNVCFSIQANFYGQATPEDLVLRILDQADSCLGMCTLRPQQNDALLVLGSDVSSSELQLSMAGENAGVSWIPIKWGAPMAWVVPVESGGYILITAHLMEGKGQSMFQFSNSTFIHNGKIDPNVLIHLLHLPPQSSALGSSSDVRHSEYPPSAAQLQHILEGVKSAPVMSRSEVARGPSSGAYIIPASTATYMPDSSNTLLISHEAMDVLLQNNFRICAVVLKIAPIDLSCSTDDGAFSPVVSIIGHAVLSVTNTAVSKQNTPGGISKILTGELVFPPGSNETEDGGNSSITVNVLISPLTSRPPPTEPKPELASEALDKKPADEGSTSEDTKDEKTAAISGSSEEAQLKSSEQLLYDGDETKVSPPEATEAEVETEKLPEPASIETENNSLPSTELSPTDPEESPQAEDVPAEGSKMASPLAAAPLSSSLSSSGGIARGNNGYPVNPRHVLSSSSVILTGGNGGNSTSASALTDTLTAELQTKQRTIDKMRADESLHKETLKAMEEENQKLKNENSRIKLRIAEAHTSLARREQESEDAGKYVQELSRNPDAFSHWDRDLLVHLIKEAGVHIRRLETEAHGLREAVASTEKIRAKYGNVCTQLSDLQDAHLSQAKQMQKLKERVSKVKSYEETIRAQEEVITRMQSVLETQLRAKPSSRTAGVTLSQSLLSKSMPGKHQSDGSDTTESPVAKPIFAEEDPKMKKELVNTKKLNEKLSNELEMKSRRVESLEKQLIVSAQEASKEISNLRTKLLDYELNRADTQPFTGGEYDSPRSFDMDKSYGGDLAGADSMRHKLMVPFESMANVSFEQYVSSNGNRGNHMEDEGEDDGFLNYKKSAGMSNNSSSKPTIVASTSSSRHANSTDGKRSRPSSGSNRLESLIKPLGVGNGSEAGTMGDDGHGYY